MLLLHKRRNGNLRLILGRESLALLQSLKEEESLGKWGDHAAQQPRRLSQTWPPRPAENEMDQAAKIVCSRVFRIFAGMTTGGGGVAEQRSTVDLQVELTGVGTTCCLRAREEMGRERYCSYHRGRATFLHVHKGTINSMADCSLCERMKERIDAIRE